MLCNDKTKLVQISIINKCEIANLIEVHRGALPDDVLPNLGVDVMTRYYDKVFLLQESQKAILFGAYSQDRLVGFCCLLFEQISFLSIINFNTIRILFVILISNPLVLMKLICQLVHSFPLLDNSSEIAYFAVSEGSRGQGVGRFLIKKCIEKSKKLNLKYVQTKTSNSQLYKFYVKCFSANLLKEFHVGKIIYRVVNFQL